MKKLNLENVSTELLIEELTKRKELNKIDPLKMELNEIRQRIKSMKLICGVEFVMPTGETGLSHVPQYILGIVTGKRQKFKDFYNNSGIEYEEWCGLIPSCFHECQESTYEFSDRTSVYTETNHKTAIDILKEAGYTVFRDITEEYS